MSAPEDTVSVNINGQDVQVAKGTNVIEVAKKAGFEIPHYCYHKKLSISGNCRMCLVEMGLPAVDRETRKPVLDEQGQPKINWMPRPAIGCGTEASEGLHIKTNSQLVKDCQNGVTEFLLANHPLDCPICDQAGECTLQEYSAQYGRGESRFIEEKNRKPKQVELGPRVTLDDERCILCSRCIRFCKEIVDDDVLGFTERGSSTVLTCYPGKKLENNYSLNTVDICPVGALTSTDFRFQMRTWFLKRTPSICTESSVGVNTTIFSREGKIYRITPRDNDAVNDCWMSDSGRALYKINEAQDRLTKFLSNNNSISSEEAFMRFSEILSIGHVGCVASAQLSLEEQFWLKKLVDVHNARCWMFPHEGQGDGLLISEDRTPNFRGALLTGLVDRMPHNDAADLKQALENEELKVLIVYGEDLNEVGIDHELLKNVEVIYLGTHSNRTCEQANLAIPTATVFEKSGCFVNQQFRVQKFSQAVPPPAGVFPDILTLSRVILASTSNPALGKHASLSETWDAMREAIDELAGLHISDISAQGACIDGKRFAHLDFIEGKTLNFNPKKAATAGA